MHVVRRELVIPFQLAGLRIQRHDRIGVEVVALAIVAVVIRTGIADRPVHRVELRIVGAGIHVAPHGMLERLPFQVSDPGSPGLGTVQNRQTSLPVA